MKHLTLFTIALVFSSLSYGSAVYMNDGRVQLAIEAIHGIGTTGVGEKNGSCLLCHASSAGGANNINGSFGADFVTAARRVIGTDGGNGLQATGPLSLESIFSDAAFAALDSDGDNVSNGDEFANDTDPADDVEEPVSSGGGDSGGCGMITPTDNRSNFPPASALLLLLPLIVLLTNKKSRLT